MTARTSWSVISAQMYRSITLLLYHHHQNKWQICTHSLEVVHRPAMFGSSMRLFAKVQADAEEAVLTFDCIRHSSAPFISVKFLFGVTNKQWLCAKGYRSTIVVGQRSVLVWVCFVWPAKCRQFCCSNYCCNCNCYSALQLQWLQFGCISSSSA